MAIKKSTPTPKPTPKATTTPVNTTKGFEGLVGAGKGFSDFFNSVGANAGQFGAVLGTTFGQAANPYAPKTANPYAPKPTPTTQIMASNYGMGAGGAVIGKGITPVLKPGANIGTGSGTGTGMGRPAAQKPLSELLRVPGIDAIYQPVVNYLGQQETAAKDRYAVNNANVKNIFSALTGLTAQDSARITKQFTDSLTASKADLAMRTAEARQGAAAGTAQAAATGAERGSGDAMAVNPVQVAAEEGIARSNEYATTWQALQGANQQQAQADLSARGAGYGQQEVGAIQQLAQGLEDRLLAIGGNTAQVQSDIAQAKFGQETNIAQANYAEAIAARDAAQRAAAAASRPAADNTPAIDKIRQQLGSRFDGLLNGLTDAYAEAYTRQNPKGSTKITKPNASDVMAIWVGGGGGTDVVNEANTVARLLYNK